MWSNLAMVTELKADNLCSQPINDTRLNRCLAITAIRLLRPFARRWGCVLFLSPWMCVKMGPTTDYTEARTMQFISQRTGIPVPKVYCCFRRKGTTYIVMERIRGQCLRNAWYKLSAEARTKILEQLKAMVDEMRRIPASNDHVASVDNGSLWDCRTRFGLDRFGPFDNAADFHECLRDGLASGPSSHPEVDEMISLQKKDWGPPVFTHGDLNSLNIMVHGDEVVGIVDWETSGWYPPYWEYTSASQVNPRNQFWEDFIDQFLEAWPNALAMEKTRQTWWGVIWSPFRHLLEH